MPVWRRPNSGHRFGHTHDLPRRRNLAVSHRLRGPCHPAQPFRIADLSTGEWHALSPDRTIPPTATADTPLDFTDPVIPATVTEYRIYYTFGGRFSAPSNVVTASGDSDRDGLPDWWEIKYGFNVHNTDDAEADADPDQDGIANIDEFLAGTDPRDYYNGKLPVITLESGNNQESPAGAWLPQPLTVKVTLKGTNPPVALVNAPVTFAVAAGRGKIGTADQVEASTPTVTLLTDDLGHAQVWYHQPTHARVRSRITATAVSATRSARTEFHARTTTPPPPPGGGGDPGDGEPGDDPDGDWDHDGLTNAEEEAIGSDPQNANSDDDGVPDGQDAMPADDDISFPRAGAAHYALIDIGPGSINAINGKGQAVGTVPPADGSTADATAFFWDKGQRKTCKAANPCPTA